MKNPNQALFIYCPRCGEDTLSPDSIKSFVCTQCGFRFFLNTAAAVAALITDESQKLLVTVRRNNPGKGTWDLPGGFLDPNETVEEALPREIREELNLTIVSTGYFCSMPNLYEFNGVQYSTIDLAYLCKVRSFSQIRPNDEVSSYLFVQPCELKPEKFGLESIRSIISQYLESIQVQSTSD